ncbi:hypothetical protein CesoFtcFv8_003034 [Champsocephalus esox]|uniref:Uncharacterized protein n=1 Tax=Champsocephalus esox TaxID=159716 RepID=A0AAN8HEJ0_9TELE|nr:hypothetical protein CesoFtcFv8_003034 [Champsocephalus esox]
MTSTKHSANPSPIVPCGDTHVKRHNSYGATPTEAGAPLAVPKRGRTRRKCEPPDMLDTTPDARPSKAHELPTRPTSPQTHPEPRGPR